jgi:hypothetical protein
MASPPYGSPAAPATHKNCPVEPFAPPLVHHHAAPTRPTQSPYHRQAAVAGQTGSPKDEPFESFCRVACLLDGGEKDVRGTPTFGLYAEDYDHHHHATIHVLTATATAVGDTCNFAERQKAATGVATSAAASCSGGERTAGEIMFFSPKNAYGRMLQTSPRNGRVGTEFNMWCKVPANRGLIEAYQKENSCNAPAAKRACFAKRRQ